MRAVRLFVLLTCVTSLLPSAAQAGGFRHARKHEQTVSRVQHYAIVRPDGSINAVAAPSYPWGWFGATTTRQFEARADYYGANHYWSFRGRD